MNKKENKQKLLDMIPVLQEMCWEYTAENNVDGIEAVELCGEILRTGHAGIADTDEKLLTAADMLEVLWRVRRIAREVFGATDKELIGLAQHNIIENAGKGEKTNAQIAGKLTVEPQTQALCEEAMNLVDQYPDKETLKIELCNLLTGYAEDRN